MCNGWTNYETWVATLYIMDVAEQLAAEYPDIDKYDLGEQLHRLVQDEIDSYEPVGLINDLLNAAIGSINFIEIAKSVLEDAKGSLDSEEE